jgi:hypothetical protein
MFNVNVNPETGIRYGVIAFDSLAEWCYEELWYGAGATNVSEEEAAEEGRMEARQKWESHLEEAEIAATEVDPHMSEDDRAQYINDWFYRMGIESDMELFIEREMDHFFDCCQIDEPVIEGECDGVKYHISWLGGAPLLWVNEGPVGVANRLCSPCVPNAADLDGGFVLESEATAEASDEVLEAYEHGYPCYCVPRDWLRKED